MKRFYGRLSIQTKFTLCILVAVIIPFAALTMMFSKQFYNMIIADTIRSEQEASAQTAPLIEAVLMYITDAHEALIEDAYYQTLFFHPVSEDLTTLAESQDAVDFAAHVKSVIDEGTIKTVHFYLDIPEDDAFFHEKTSSNLFLPLSEVKGTYWYGIFQGSHPNALYCPPSYLGPREREEYGDLAYITAASLYREGTSVPCYMVLYYSSETYTQTLTDALTLPGSVSYLINEREALLATTDDYLSGIYRLSYTDIQDSSLSSNNFMERDVLGEKLYVGFYYIRESGWFLVTVLPRAPLIEQGNRIILNFILFCLICIVAAIGIAIWQSRSITVRLSSIIRQMALVREDLPMPLPAPVVQDEVGELISTYNYMTEKMNLLIEQQKQTSEELRITEFHSLQAQINPHFLYNTMDMINWMALQGRTAEVSSVVQNLARFYKLTLSRKQDFNTITDELEHVSIYVQLQNMRFQNSIDFVVDIPDELGVYGIPKLTLQPIVENAILHGILEKEEKSGTIVITGWLEEDAVIILVSDDGAGIPANKLPYILSGSSTHKTSGTNIAVANIHKRLQLLYGAVYGLTYRSTEGAGCEVEIRLPLTTPENMI